MVDIQCLAERGDISLTSDGSPVALRDLSLPRLNIVRQQQGLLYPLQNKSLTDHASHAPLAIHDPLQVFSYIYFLGAK